MRSASAAKQALSSPRRVSVVDETAVEGIKHALLQPRKVLLSGKRPKNPRTHEIRREISSGKNKAIQSILAVILADIEDGIPLATATQALQQMLTLAELHHAKRERRATSGVLPIGLKLCRAIVRETRAQAIGDIEVTEALAKLDDPNEIREAVMALQVEEAEREELVGVLTEHLVQIEGGL